jgi:hypothetical protein
MPAVMLRDAYGNTVPPGVQGGTPVLASGITLTDAATGADHTQALVAGATYKIMSDAIGGWVFGVATVATAANIIWFVPPSQAVCITMPPGYATLHYMCLVNGGSCYIAKMADNVPTGMTTT